MAAVISNTFQFLFGEREIGGKFSVHKLCVVPKENQLFKENNHSVGSGYNRGKSCHSWIKSIWFINPVWLIFFRIVKIWRQAG